MSKWIQIFLKFRLVILVVFVALSGFGLMALLKLPIDAVPDITNVQVVVNTKTGALDPEQIEKTITRYIETEMNGIAHVEDIRSLSKYGLSQVVIVFTDKTDIYWARQQVAERLQTIQSQLPEGISPELAPITTGLGEVVMYVVEAKPNSELIKLSEKERLLYLRTVQETLIRPYLKNNVKNIAEIDSNGGYKKEIHVAINPLKLTEYGLSFSDVTSTLKGLGESAGGGYIDYQHQQLIVRTNGVQKTLQDLENTPLKLMASGQLLRLKDVAEVKQGAAQRLGAATYQGHETVLGTVLMLTGANSRQVALDTEARLATAPIPHDVQLKIVYSRAYLVNATIHTVIKNLAEGAFLVVVVLVLLLGNLRAAFLVALTIPLSLMLGAIGMKKFGVSANLISLGAVDFGLVVDASVVVIENVLRKFRDEQGQLKGKEKIAVIVKAVSEVAPPVVLGMILIMLVYVPVLYLEGIEGKLFKPMAMTVLLVLGAALALAIIVMPIIAFYVISKDQHEEKEPRLFVAIRNRYEPLLVSAFRFRKMVVLLSGILVISSFFVFHKLGSDFMPALNEGDMVLNLTRDSKISLEQSIIQQQQSEAELKKFPEIAGVFSRLGTPESATDPMGPHLSDTFLILEKDHSKWRSIFPNKESLFQGIKQRLTTTLPDQEVMQTQPIEMRFNEMLEGSRADVAIKIFGNDLNQLMILLDQTIRLIEPIKGVSEVEMDALTALRKSPVLNVTINPDTSSRLGIDLHTINTVLETGMTGQRVGSFYENNWRYPIMLRVDDVYKNTPEKIAQFPVELPTGGSVSLAQVAQLKIQDQVTTIAHHKSERYAGISIGLEGRDVGSFVTEAQALVKRQITLNEGYRIEWGGQFKNMQKANKQLMVVIPFTLLAILLLLIAYLRNMRHTFLVYLSIPFAVSGGIVALFLSGMTFTVSAGIGFIALSGIAILNGLVLVTFMNQLVQSGQSSHDAAMHGAHVRLRPVLMTALVASLGFIPMALNTGLGSEVQRPLAIVVIGGLVSATLSTLILLPVLYAWISKSE